MATQAKEVNPAQVLKSAAAQFGKVLRDNKRKDALIARLQARLDAAKGVKAPAAKKAAKPARKARATDDETPVKLTATERKAARTAKAGKTKVAAKKAAKKVAAPATKTSKTKVVAKKAAAKKGKKSDASFFL